MTLEPVETKPEQLLFFTDNEHDEALGCIGHLRLDFGQSGKEFYTTWFDHACSDKRTARLSERFDAFINLCRESLLNDRAAMKNYCRDKDEAKNPHGTGNNYGFRAFDGNYAYYLRCSVSPGDYDGYCYVYDRNALMEYLAGKAGLPSHCYSKLLTDGTPIMIRYAEKGYYPLSGMPDDVTVDKLNAMLSVTTAQKQAMEVGSMYGWNVAGADPHYYEKREGEKKTMKIAIYQINADRDSDGVMYRSLEAAKEITGADELDASLYDKLYQGEIKASSLEDVFDAFNTDKPAEFKGHSLSVSDVVEVLEADDVESGCYYCDSIGFEKIDFDTLECANRAPMRVLIVEPGKPAYEKIIDPGLASLQAEVGGTIETCYPFDDDVMIICDDEGKLNGKELNRALRDEDNQIYDVIAGTFILCGSGYADCVSLTDEQAARYKDLYKTPECFLRVNGNLHVFPMQAAANAELGGKADKAKEAR